MPRTPRTHGTYAMYVRGPSILPDPRHVPRPDGRAGCRCDPCKVEARRRNRTDSYLRDTGRSKYVDAARARAHVQRLLDAGMTRFQIAELTHGAVDRTSVRALMVGQGGRPPGRRIRRATEAALLAVPVCPAGQAAPDRGTVPSVGTVRRLQALLAAGHQQVDLAEHVGVSSSNLSTLLTRDRVLAVTARRVATVYERLEQRPGSPKVAARYKARGYLEPGWWDPDTIDDPDHRPRVDVPGGAADKADRRQERRDTVAELLEQGLNVGQVVDELQRDRLIDPMSHETARRLVERDKAWWRARGRRLEALAAAS